MRTDLWLFFTGLFAASVNAAAGGGTLLSFPALLAAGLPPLTANVTSAVGLFPGLVASAVAYRGELSATRRTALRLLVPALLGGGLGAWLLLFLGGAVFSRAVPALLVCASLLLLTKPILSRAGFRRRESGTGAALNSLGGTNPGRIVASSETAAWAAIFLISVYGGYFGAGQGILFLGAMGALLTLPIGEVNALRVLNALANNTIGVAVFIGIEALRPSGALSARDALPVALGAALGGYFGGRIVRRLPEPALRMFAAAVGLSLAAYSLLKR